MQAGTGSRVLVAAMLLVVALTGCKREPQGDDQVTGSMTGDAVKAAREDWPAQASVMVDSANEAYRAKDLQTALRQYEAALKVAGNSKSVKVTSYFGIYMVQHALGDSAAAAAAMVKAQELAPEASMMHGAMPMGTTSGEQAPRTPNDSIHRRQ